VRTRCVLIVAQRVGAVSYTKDASGGEGRGCAVVALVRRGKAAILRRQEGAGGLRAVKQSRLSIMSGVEWLAASAVGVVACVEPWVASAQRN
jgi:hypothetical protein